MVYVILKNGKVLQYNSGDCYEVKSEWCNVKDGDRMDSGTIASIPTVNIERVEFRAPCRVMREKKIRPHAAKY